MTNSVSLYVPGDSGLHRLNPTTKLLLTLTIILFGFVFPVLWSCYAAFLFIILPLSVWGRIWKQMISSVWKITLPFAISILLIQGLFWGEGTTIYSFGPLTIEKEGLIFALISIGRIILVIGSFLLLALSTRPDYLMSALNSLGMPGALTYIVVASIQIVPRFQARASMIIDAQRSRGLSTEGNVLQRARALIPLIMPLILSSLVDVEERSMAIEARAFNAPGSKTSLTIIVDTGKQRIARWAMLIVIILLIGYRIWQLLT